MKCFVFWLCSLFPLPYNVPVQWLHHCWHRTNLPAECHGVMTRTCGLCSEVLRSALSMTQHLREKIPSQALLLLWGMAHGFARLSLNPTVSFHNLPDLLPGIFCGNHPGCSTPAPVHWENNQLTFIWKYLASLKPGNWPFCKCFRSTCSLTACVRAIVFLGSDKDAHRLGQKKAELTNSLQIHSNCWARTKYPGSWFFFCSFAPIEMLLLGSASSTKQTGSFVNSYKWNLCLLYNFFLLSLGRSF